MYGCHLNYYICSICSIHMFLWVLFLSFRLQKILLFFWILILISFFMTCSLNPPDLRIYVKIFSNTHVQKLLAAFNLKENISWYNLGSDKYASLPSWYGMASARESLANSRDFKLILCACLTAVGKVSVIFF